MITTVIHASTRCLFITYLVLPVNGGQDYVVLELERIYQLVKCNKPIFEHILNQSVLPRAA